MKLRMISRESYKVLYSAAPAFGMVAVMQNTEKRRRAKPATPEKYIWRKPDARHLWFRCGVPIRYQPAYGKKIVQRSTGTTDLWEASILAGKWRAELFDEWEDLVAPDEQPALPKVDRPLIEPTIFDLQAEATAAAFLKVQSKLDLLRLSKALGSNQALDQYTRSLKDNLLRLVRTRDTDARHLWERMADKAIERQGWKLPRNSDLYNQFVKMIAEAGLEALRIDVERNSGNLGAQTTSAVVETGLKAMDRSAAAGEGILELFDRYAKQRCAEQRKREDSPRAI